MIEPWFDPAAYSFVPGVAVGLACGAIGVVGGVLAARGKAWALVHALYVIVLAASVALLIGGIVALAKGQPYGVWMGLGQPGLIGLVALGVTYGVMRRRFRDVEVRRMHAADLD